MAARANNTRSAVALDLWRERLPGAVVAIGNAPTALFRLLELLDEGIAPPAAIIGMPVGFIGAAESKEALFARSSREIDHRARTQGRQRDGGGGAQRARERGGMNAQRPQTDRTVSQAVTAGTLHGVGVGPGDPELMTLRAARLISEARAVAYFAKRGARGHARTIAARWIDPACEEIPLHYPMTTETHWGDGTYVDALRGFYENAAATSVAIVSRRARTSCLLCEGDPLFYGSYMHLHARLCGRFKVAITSGVTGMAGCWGAAGLPMTWGDDALAVLPGTLDEDALVARLASTDAAVIMKLGSNFPKVRRALARAGLLDRAVYVERGTMADERVVPLRDKHDDAAPYFSLMLVPGNGRRP